MITSTASLSRNEIQAALAKRMVQLGQASAKLEAKATSIAWARWIAILGLAAVVLYFVNHPYKAAPTELIHEAPAPLRSVSLAKPEVNSGRSELLLPAEVRAFQTTAINSRIAGYLKNWKVDRGDRVQAGQVLAEIDAPEFDQELLRAQSDLEEGRTQLAQTMAERDQAVANVTAAVATVDKSEATRELAAKTETRFKDLEEKWAATRQQYDEAVRNHDAARADVAATKAQTVSAQAAVATREAAIRSAQAHVNSLEAGFKRLKEQEAFKTIVAPYSGVITQRNADAGALVATDGSRPLFIIVQDDTLRVTANVPQTYASLVKTGLEADVVAREFSADGLKARVARTSGAIDASARTLAVELELPNDAHRVFPGAFVQIKFILQDSKPAVLVPVNTLRYSKDGTQVFSVDTDGRLLVHAVKLGRDFGTRIEVLDGFSGKSALVVNPTDSMVSGEKVHVEVTGQDKVASN